MNTLTHPVETDLDPEFCTYRIVNTKKDDRENNILTVRTLVLRLGSGNIHDYVSICTDNRNNDGVYTTLGYGYYAFNTMSPSYMDRKLTEIIELHLLPHELYIGVSHSATSMRFLYSQLPRRYVDESRK